MKITVFTSNQPRHLALIRKLADMGEVCAVQECATLFPGAVKDSIYNASPLMQRYFDRVTGAEREVFGDVGFTPAKVRSLSLKMGDIQYMASEQLRDALDANYIVVFGASYIKPPLIDALIEKRAVNIHMGVSPQFRGSACNFWALHDGYPELVGATIHLLSRGLDSGDMLFHALPAAGAYDPFLLGMKAVEAAQNALCKHIENGSLYKLAPVAQDKSKEIRYSRYADFTDDVVERYLSQLPSAADVETALRQKRGNHELVRPAIL